MIHNHYRQKAHLQRHETTHGVGVKVSRGSTSAARRKRKRSRAASSSGGGVPATTSTIVTTQQPQNAALSVNLQQRLARVSEQFGTTTGSGGTFTKASDGTEDDEDDEDLAVNHGDGTMKSYSKVSNNTTIFLVNDTFNPLMLTFLLQRKASSDDKSEEDEDDEDGLRESKTTVTIQLDQAEATSQVFHRVCHSYCT